MSEDKYAILNVSALLRMLNNISMWDDNDTTRDNIDEIKEHLENCDTLKESDPH